MRRRGGFVMGEVLTAVVHAGEDWFRTRETKKEQRWQRRISTALYPLPEQELLSQYARGIYKSGAAV